jgi:putative CocE/NonD family hydrolase
MDQGKLESRPDVVTFTTAPLAEDLEVTGRVTAEVFFSTDAPRALLAVRLCDVYPDGRSILIAEGIRRLSAAKKSAAEEGSHGPTEVEVDLWSTSIVFARGHRIRFSISGANFPRWAAVSNPHDASDGRPVRHVQNTVHVGTKTPSRLVLPVVATAQPVSLP